MAPRWLVFVIVVVAANNDTDRDTRLGRGGSPNVVCGPWTNRLVYIGFTQLSKPAVFQADKSTKRCVVTYRLTSCREMEFTCTKLMVDNRDPDQCKRGNALTIKAENTKPERFCKKDYLGPVFPARSMGDMKVWYVNTEEDYLGKGRYKNQGANCTATCHRI